MPQGRAAAGRRAGRLSASIRATIDGAICRRFAPAAFLVACVARMAASSDHPGVRFRPWRPHGLPRGRRGAARCAIFVYVADDAAFPYGALRGARARLSRVVTLMGELIAAHRPDLVGDRLQHRLDPWCCRHLRQRFSVPFVGTVPAIKPACAASVTRRVSVLGTEATVAREYTRALIRDYAGDCQVTLVGSKKLAAYAEAELAGTPVSDAVLSRRDRPLLSSTTAAAPTPSCSPAPTIRC